MTTKPFEEAMPPEGERVELPPHYGTKYFRTPRVVFKEINGQPLWHQFCDPTYYKKVEEGFCREYLAVEEHEHLLQAARAAAFEEARDLGFNLGMSYLIGKIARQGSYSETQIAFVQQWITDAQAARKAEDAVDWNKWNAEHDPKIIVELECEKLELEKRIEFLEQVEIRVKDKGLRERDERIAALEAKIASQANTIDPPQHTDLDTKHGKRFEATTEYHYQKKIEKLEERLAAAESALKFYARNDNYDREGAIWDGEINSDTWTDRGDKARSYFAKHPIPARGEGVE